MTSFTFSVLLLVISIPRQDTAVIRHVDLDQHKRFKGTGLEHVIHKYLNPLRRLTAELPNHAIELQVEILDQAPSAPPVPVPQRRVYRVMNRHPKTAKIARTNEVSSTPALLKQGPDEETTSPPAHDASTSSHPAVPTTTAAATSTAHKPIYMEDLQRALSDLEKKLEQKHADNKVQAAGLAKPCDLQAQHSAVRNAPQARPSTRRLAMAVRSDNVQNIDDILEILKKAVHIEKHIPQPSDDNLEWIQIKIPKQ